MTGTDVNLLQRIDRNAAYRKIIDQRLMQKHHARVCTNWAGRGMQPTRALRNR
jgi:hypothetical protein